MQVGEIVAAATSKEGMAMTDILDRPETDIADLVIIDGKDAFSVFSAKRENGSHPIDPILARVRKEIDGFKSDLSTAASRKRIAAIAHAVAKAKTSLETLGADMTREQKDIPNRIIATRNHIKATLDAWRDEVRQPLTDWEAAEQAKIEAHTIALHGLQRLGKSRDDLDRPLSAEALRANLARLEGYPLADVPEDYRPEYKIVIDGALPALKAALVDREKYEADQAALAKFREEAAAREAKERDDCLRKEGEDRARLDAENDLRMAVLAADNARRKAADEAEAQVLAAHRETEAANARAIAAEAKAKAEIAAKLKADADAQATREADKEHRRKINQTAAGALMENGLSKEMAKLVISLIFEGKISHVKIEY